jgi:hypothetical protein
MIAILIPRAAPCRHRHFEIVPHSGPDVLVKLEFVVQRIEAGEPATCMPSGKAISKGAGTDCLGLIYVIKIFEFLIFPPALSDLPRLTLTAEKGEKIPWQIKLLCFDSKSVVRKDLEVQVLWPAPAKSMI